MLNFTVWHKNGTREAFFMHVMAVLDAMKKRGHFKDYDRAHNKRRKAEDTTQGNWVADGTTRGGMGVDNARACGWLTASGGSSGQLT